MAADFDQPRELRARDGTRIAWRVRAPAVPARDAGAPVLLLHGLASNATRFAEFVEHTTLVQRHKLIRVDLRGHGRAITRRRTGIEAWSDDLAAVLDAEGGDRSAAALLVGHSLGAQVALQFARRHPARVGGLVLIDPVFRSALHGRWRLLATVWPLLALAAAAVRGVNALGLHRGALPPLDLRALDEAARVALASSPEAERAFIEQYSSARADLRHVPLAVYLQDLVEMFRPAPLPRELGRPVLALLSSGATFADAGEMRAALAGPQVMLRTVHCQHWPLTERPAEVRRMIEQWVGALGGLPGQRSSPST
ncbi:MAG: alpha/beta hydrolase [Rubrivivax sp.]|nr:alpha/beta hydrolase [Rubrivivax sp.]